MIVAFSAFGLAGLASLPLWPEPWRAGLGAGWVAGLALEWWLNRQRLALMRAPGGGRNLLRVIAAGFLLKLLVLGAGAAVGAFTALFSVAPFLLAFLAAVLLGEAFGLTAVARAQPRASVREDLR